MCFSWTVVRYRSPDVVLPMISPVLLCWFMNESGERGAKLCRILKTRQMFLYIVSWMFQWCALFGLNLYGFACKGFSVALALGHWIVTSLWSKPAFLYNILNISKPTFYSLIHSIYYILYSIFDIHILIDGRSYLTGRCQHLLDFNQMSAVYGLWKSNKALTDTCFENSMCRVAASFAKIPAKRPISSHITHTHTLPNSKLNITSLS